MKILFLDVDGVLNSYSNTNKDTHSPHGTFGVEEKHLVHLRRILDTCPEVQIVLCSTWRKYRDMVYYLWNKLGVKYKERWAGNTPILNTRADEIKFWVNKQTEEVTHWVVLDDQIFPDEIEGHIVNTDCLIGLTAEIADQVIEKFK